MMELMTILNWQLQRSSRLNGGFTMQRILVQIKMKMMRCIFLLHLSGFLIMFDPLLKVGDNVQVQGEAGIIRYIGVRNSMLETDDGTKVVLPNATNEN